MPGNFMDPEKLPGYSSIPEPEVDETKPGRNDLAPEVSVILPVYNGEEFLAEAVESVLLQSYQSYELIVVDDGSTDRTREIAQTYPSVRYISQTHGGAASARNRGIQEARGEYLAFLDGDDLWMPDKLALQLEAFTAHPEVEIVTGHVEQFVSPPPHLAQTQTFLFARGLLPGLSPIAILIRRSLIAKVGLFDEKHRRSEVIGWFAKAIEKNTRILTLPDVVARRRIHGKNVSLTDQVQKDKDMLKILKDSLDRRRAGKSPEGGSH